MPEILDTDYPLTYALAESLKEHLQEKMIDNMPAQFQRMMEYVDKDDQDRVFAPSLIKTGRLQDDPTVLSASSAIPSVGIYIHYNDPSDTGDGWKDGICSAVDSSMTNAAFQIPVYEIGGGEMWWRRFWVEWEMFAIDADFDQETAYRIAAALKQGIEYFANRSSTVNPDGWECVIRDQFHECSLFSKVVKSHLWEGGGPPDDYIWRGGVWLQVLTEREA